MKEKNNIDFESLLQNEEFIKLLKGNTIQADQLINQLCLENREREESIRLAAQLVRRYQLEQMPVDEEEIPVMWDNILNKVQAGKPERMFHLNAVWRIAASVALLLSVTIYCYRYTSDKSIRNFADKRVEVSDEARIIISDGTEHLLNSNNSYIKYESDGKEIVIQNKNHQSEKVANSKTDAEVTYNQIVVPFGHRHGLMLSDGTVIQLNSGSKLVFPAKFGSGKREVYLKGEAYFEVTKDVAKPFIVHTGFMNVKVLGTSFNISAYDNEKTASAVLVEGSVEVFDDSFFNKNLVKIKPGEGCFYTGSNSKFKTQKVDINEYVSWKDGYFQLNNQPFGNITRKVEKYYNKTIVFDDDALSHRIISGKLVLASRLEETLDFLARTTKSKYSIRSDGTYVFIK